MKETVLVIEWTCDLHGKEAKAVNTIVTGLNHKEFEVDVCDECNLLLSDLLGRAMKAGRAPSPRRRGSQMHDEGRRMYLQELRDWADAKGLKNELYPELPVYQYHGGVRGGLRKDYFQYTQKLLEQFESEREQFEQERARVAS